MPPPPDLFALSLDDVRAVVASQAFPPVADWHPARCGNSEMRIAADGSWFHRGRPIKRPELIRLFSRILRREPDGAYVLVTPAERLDIAVDDAPFVAVACRRYTETDRPVMVFALNTGDLVIADAAHRLRLDQRTQEARPYLGVRPGLDALLSRAVYYQVADAVTQHGAELGVWSDAAFFAFGSAA